MWIGMNMNKKNDIQLSTDEAISVCDMCYRTMATTLLNRRETIAHLNLQKALNLLLILNSTIISLLDFTYKLLTLNMLYKTYTSMLFTPIYIIPLPSQNYV